MIAYACLKISVFVGKTRAAFGRIWVKKPKRFGEVGNASPVYRPTRNVVMHLRGRHIPNALLLICRAFELPRRMHDIVNGIISAVFAHRLLDAVHDDGGNRLHALYSLTAGLALYQPRQKFQFVHISSLYAALSARVRHFIRKLVI